MITASFEKFLQRLLPRCIACGVPGPAICPACQRFHDYSVEVEQRKKLLEGAA